jgi:hypothetical protein
MRKGQYKNGKPFNRTGYMATYNHKRYMLHRERELARARTWRTENPEMAKERRRSWYIRLGKRYRLENIEKIRENARRYSRKPSSNKHVVDRRRADPNLNLAHILRARVGHAVKRQYGVKAYTTVELLGCSIEEARRYLESKFEPWMNWNNHGEWHIDHIIPVTHFDLTKPEEQKKAFHFTNLQPLLGGDNIRKYNHLPTER